MGEIFEAFRAGYKPKTKPIIIETDVAIIIELSGIMNSQVYPRSPIIKAARNETSAPRIIPITPPINVMKIDSSKNCVTM
jgi:hypothetical protein